MMIEETLKTVIRRLAGARRRPAGYACE